MKICAAIAGCQPGCNHRCKLVVAFIYILGQLSNDFDFLTKFDNIHSLTGLSGLGRFINSGGSAQPLGCYHYMTRFSIVGRQAPHSPQVSRQQPHIHSTAACMMRAFSSTIAEKCQSLEDQTILRQSRRQICRNLPVLERQETADFSMTYLSKPCE
jgi:hypothetical protein